MLKILAIDPSVNALKLLSSNLEQYGYELQGALDFALARNVAKMGYRAEILMVNLSLCQPTLVSELHQLFQDLNNPYLSIIAISDLESETATMRAQAMGFRGVICKPFKIKLILAEIEQVARLDPAECNFTSPGTRKEQRLRMALEVEIETTDEETNRALSEQTITEDISRNGACVLTMLEVRVGSFVAINVIGQNGTSMGVVRGSFIGSDRIRRLNLEMIGKQWEEIYTRITGEFSGEAPDIVAVGMVKEMERTGQVLNDRYELQHMIGKGGLGVVYRALDLFTQQIVAVKLLLESFDRPNEESLPRQYFEREIQLLTKVRHPNIVAVLDSGVTRTGHSFLVMEFVEGQVLSDLIGVNKVWSVARTLHLLKQLCPALHAMHLQNIIHRDLKPANIMIQRAGRAEVAKLLDLGIAKMVCGNEGTHIKTITQAGTIVGTVQYISPEQCLGKELDARADIYALGVMTYELLTGCMPFSSDSLSGWLLAHLQTLPISLRNINPQLSPAIDQVVLWALSKECDARPTTTMQFLQAFEKAASEYEASTQELHPTTAQLDYCKDSVNSRETMVVTPPSTSRPTLISSED
ncbi:MAG: protein kinase [Acidobacteriota bacterium]